MLISLKMKCWRKHVDKFVEFGPGLNAVRGANENGKTSMLMAILYALWGVKALPLPLAEMVTWGHEEKEAGVELVMNVGGELYSFKRSKAGAECNHSGGVVTGQDEVSAFASKLVGADAKLAQSLMFASQSGMRGALDAGPTAINEYIEDMAGMDLFDRLLDLISEKLATGPTTRLDGEVAELEAKLEAGGPVEPVFTEENERIAAMEADVKANEALLADAEKEAAAANDAYSDAKARADVRETALANLKATEGQCNRRQQALEADRAAAGAVVNEARITELEMAINDEEAAQARQRAYTAFSKLVVPETIWEGNEASLKAEIASTRSKLRDLQVKTGTVAADIRVLESKLVTSSICGYCAQDLSKFPEVAAKNAEVNAQIEAKRLELASLNESLAEVMGELPQLEAVLESAAPFHTYLRQSGQYVTVDDGHVPPKLLWNGEIPAPASTPVASLKTELAELKKAAAAKAAAAARLGMLEAALEEDRATVQRLQASIGEPVELDGLYQKKLAADTKLADIQKAVSRGREDVRNLHSVKSGKLAEYTVAKRAFDAIPAALEAKKKERDDLVFNNNLQKKVKAARPTIAAELWGLVLTSASVMFTNMRGEQSVITKVPKDFLVNGKTYRGLSGSAMDLMGYAIRVALLKTFIPDCSFMIMDEATAACDDNRTMSLFGFIASAGFKQTLLVTHDPAAESVADSVIMI